MTSENQIRKGNDLMLFIDDSSVAFATNHTLTLSAEEEELNTKDHGYNGAKSIKRITWEIQSENLYIDGDFSMLFSYCNTKEAIDIVWGLATPNPQDDGYVADVEKGIASGDKQEKHKNGAANRYNVYEVDETKAYYIGKAYITSLVVNAQAGENATYSVTLTGSGDFNKVTPTSTRSMAMAHDDEQEQEEEGK